MVFHNVYTTDIDPGLSAVKKVVLLTLHNGIVKGRIFCAHKCSALIQSIV